MRQRRQLQTLREVSRYIFELANLVPNKHQAYVGNSAFAHKGGVHVSAIQRHPETYEHIRPERVGNVTRVLVSDLSGRSNILAKAEQFNINLDSKDPVTLEILEKIKEMENKGYQFEGAEASFELLMRRALGTLRHYFSVIGFRVIDTKAHEDDKPSSEATVQVKVGGKIEHTAAEGNGPVNALDHALRKALENFYPQLKEMKLLDYKVRVLPAGKGTASVTRVLIESGDKGARWGTVGVSATISSMPPTMPWSTPCSTNWSGTRNREPNRMRNPAGITLLVVILLAGFGAEWGRSLLRHGEAPPAPVVAASYVLLLGPGFPRPGVHQFSDAQSPRSVIEMTNLALAPELRDDPCLEQPLATGSGLDIHKKDNIIQDIIVFWMPAAQRLALAVPLQVDRMTRADWESLPGVGPVLARRIDLDRQKNGEFGCLKAVRRVPGVGKQRIAAWKALFEK